jgi:hypothetical protein
VSVKRILWISLLSILFLLFLCVLCVGFLATKPCYLEKYFTQPYLEKFSLLEETFEYLWRAHTSGDPEYYREVLGRELSSRESEILPSNKEIPEIIEISRGKNSAYILAENWGGSFERIKGRWVFQNQEIGFYSRQFFRVFDIELALFR